MSLDAWRAQRGPLPKPRKREIHAGVGAAVVRDAGRCQVCRARTLALDPHHLVPRSQGGDDVIPNFAALCIWAPPGHTTGCHARVTANDPETLRALRASLDALQLAYIVERKGEAWLERRYPGTAY